MKTEHTTFYIARHGETVWNLEKKIQGQSDSDLTAAGREQAKELAQHLEAITFDHVYSSDLARAHHTALILATKRNLPVVPEQRLREAFFGRLEGQPHDAFREHDERFNALSEEEKHHFRIYEEMESDHDLATRLSSFIRDKAKEHPGKTILSVSYGSIMRSLLIKLGFGTYQTLGRFKNTAHFIVESDGDDIHLRTVHGMHDKGVPGA